MALLEPLRPGEEVPTVTREQLDLVVITSPLRATAWCGGELPALTASCDHDYRAGGSGLAARSRWALAAVVIGHLYAVDGLVIAPDLLGVGGL
jgi:hypothetical protein